VNSTQAIVDRETTAAPRRMQGNSKLRAGAEAGAEAEAEAGVGLRPPAKRCVLFDHALLPRPEGSRGLAAGCEGLAVLLSVSGLLPPYEENRTESGLSRSLDGRRVATGQ